MGLTMGREVCDLGKALPSGEGAPEGGGRGAVQGADYLLPCGESVLR